MAKKPNTESEKESIESEEKSKQEAIEVDPVSFDLPYHAPFYILEISDNEEYSVFNTLEGAVKYIDELEDIETEDIKLLGFTRDKEQFNVSQISWAKIYQISRDLRKSGG